MSDWHRNSTIASTLAKARARVHGTSSPRGQGGTGKASLLDPSRPFTPLVARESRVFTTDDEAKRDWPVFYTEGTLTGRKKQSQTSRPSSSKNSSRPSSSKPLTARSRAEAAKKFNEVLCSFSSNLKELREKKTQSSVTPADLCDHAMILLAKAGRGAESLQACQAILQLPIKYSGREDSRYHKLMLKCLKRQFEHSVRQDYDELTRKYSIIPLSLKQLKKVLKSPELAPIQHVSFLLGTFRNLSEKEKNQRIMVRCDAIPLLASMLHAENLKSLRLPSAASTVNLIKEVTAILRNLALIRSHNQDFVDHAVVSLLGDLLSRFAESEHVVFGVCRILSKLTFFPACRAQVSQSRKSLQALYRVLERHRGNIPLGIRACFIMGNLTVSNDKNRAAIFSDFESKDPILLRCLADVMKRDEEISARLSPSTPKENDEKGSPSKVQMPEDAEKDSQGKADEKLSAELENYLTKVIRLVANVSINATIGKRVCTDERVGSLVSLLERKDPEKNEELVLNTISAITNISYYQVPDAMLRTCSERLLGCLMPLLFSTNSEMLHEAVRVLGNFSRYPDFRKLMGSCRVDETMAVLLDHSDEDIIFATSGVILNMSTDYAARQVLYSNGCEGLGKIIECLYRFGSSNPGIGIIICKILINLSMQGSAALEGKSAGTIKKIWLPSELSRQVEIWCEERIEKEDEQASSPILKELNEICVHLLEKLDKMASAHESAAPVQN